MIVRQNYECDCLVKIEDGVITPHLRCPKCRKEDEKTKDFFSEIAKKYSKDKDK